MDTVGQLSNVTAAAGQLLGLSHPAAKLSFGLANLGEEDGRYGGADDKEEAFERGFLNGCRLGVSGKDEGGTEEDVEAKQQERSNDCDTKINRMLFNRK